METCKRVITIINDMLPPVILHPLEYAYFPFEILIWQNFPYIFVSLLVTLLFYFFVWLPADWRFFEVGYYDMKGRKLKKELVDEVQRRRQRGEMPPVYPNGWFALLESRDLKHGQVKHVQALGENFAVMRTVEGKVHVLDAYCPHLGANMAVGGVVKGDCLECPFHGWQFRGEDGTCSHIPYSDKVPKSAAVKKWTSDEVNGLVFVWYHAEGEPPSWQVERIPDIEAGKLWYRGRSEFLIDAHIQDVFENESDIAHFDFVHTAPVFLGSNIQKVSRYVHSFLQYSWDADWKSHSSEGESHMSTMTVRLSIRIFQKFNLEPPGYTLKQIGPGLVHIRTLGFCTVFSVVPVEPLMTKFVIQMYCQPSLFIFSKLALHFGSTMVERDIMVWNYKKYVMKMPVVTKTDRVISKYRRWYSQFYSSQRFTFRRDSMCW